ncbi:MAG: hypothetical protein NEA02_06615 [Thermoanaerobaculia bacterium]|nr:hypothetical protein [Thermoanaerobaculia bacterium]
MFLVALVMVWFAAGSIWNVRKGKATLRWMQDGLHLLCERTTVRWLGTTAVELALVKSKAPFEETKLVIFLEPRDVPWLWGFSRSRGRRDSLILRARLRRAPHADLEALDRSSFAGRDAVRHMGAERWSVREPGTAGTAGGLPVFYKAEGSLPLADDLLELARAGGMTVRRLSVRRAEPHLQLHVDLPAASVDAAGFFGTVRELGELASRRA